MPRPDYGKSVSQIYQEAAEAVVKHGDLVYPELVPSPNRMRGLASCVPDGVIQICSWRDNLPGRDLSTGSDNPEYSFKKGRYLRTQGSIGGDIEEVSPVLIPPYETS